MAFDRRHIIYQMSSRVLLTNVQKRMRNGFFRNKRPHQLMGRSGSERRRRRWRRYGREWRSPARTCSSRAVSSLRRCSTPFTTPSSSTAPPSSSAATPPAPAPTTTTSSPPLTTSVSCPPLSSPPLKISPPGDLIGIFWLVYLLLAGEVRGPPRQGLQTARCFSPSLFSFENIFTFALVSCFRWSSWMLSPPLVN